MIFNRKICTSFQYKKWQFQKYSKIIHIKIKRNLSLKKRIIKKNFSRVICSFFIKSGGIEVFLTFPRKKRKKIKKTRNHTKNFFLFLTEKAGKFFRLKGFWKVIINFTKEDSFSWRRKPPGKVFWDHFDEQNVPNKMTCLVFKSSVR